MSAASGAGGPGSSCRSHSCVRDACRLSGTWFPRLHSEGTRTVALNQAPWESPGSSRTLRAPRPWPRGRCRASRRSDADLLPGLLDRMIPRVRPPFFPLLLPRRLWCLLAGVLFVLSAVNTRAREMRDLPCAACEERHAYQVASVRVKLGWRELRETGLGRGLARAGRLRPSLSGEHQHHCRDLRGPSWGAGLRLGIWEGHEIKGRLSRRSAGLSEARTSVCVHSRTVS